MPQVAHHRDDALGPLGLAGVGAVLSIGMYAVADAAFFGISIAERVAYALVWVVTLLAVALAATRARYFPRSWRFLSAWLLVAAVLLIPVIRQQPFYVEYVAGDLASVMLPALLLFLGFAVPAVFGSRAVAVLGVAMAAGMAVAPLVGLSGGRFEAPTSLLIALSFWLAAAGRDTGPRLLGLALAGTTLVAAFDSGQRTSVLIWLVALGCALILRLSLRRMIVMAVLALMVALGPARGILLSGAQESLRATRFSTVVGGEADDSLLARVNEGFDVVDTLTTQGNVASWLIGFGHGATYRPRFSFLARNVTAEGRVHNVHIGPLLVAFRYGALGLVLALLVGAKAVSVLLRSVGAAAGSRDQVPALFAIAVIAYLVESLMFNVLVDPLFSYALAGLLFHGIKWSPPMPAPPRDVESTRRRGRPDVQ